MRHHQAPRPDRLVVLDIETVPDHARIPDSQTGRFPKPIYHAIACISFVEASITIDAAGYERYAVTACRSGGEAGWDEKRLLDAFWTFFSQRPTRICGWNSRSFDCAVILQRSLLHELSAPAWFRTGSGRDGYRYRFSDTWHADLMDLLADHGACAKLGLDKAASACSLPGKMVATGSEVENMVAEGRTAEVRHYCEIDTLNTFGLYLRYALLSGRTDRVGYDAAIAGLVTYLDRERATGPHLGLFLDRWRETAKSSGVVERQTTPTTAVDPNSPAPEMDAVA